MAGKGGLSDMKNEGMANAMGRIDPELIEEAGSFKAEGKRSVRRLRPYMAAAAVLESTSSSMEDALTFNISADMVVGPESSSSRATPRAFP